MKHDKFGLHTPCTTGFRPQSQELKTQEILTEKFLFIHFISIIEVKSLIYRLYKNQLPEHNRRGTKTNKKN